LSWLGRNLLPLAVVVTVAIFLIVAVLPFGVPLGGTDTEKRLGQWSNYGQTFGIVGAVLGWLAFLCSLYTVQMQRRQIEEANKQTQEATKQTQAVIDALSRQVTMMQRNAEMNGIAALLHYLIAHQYIDPEDKKDKMIEKAHKCKRKLEDVLRPYDS
jgi:dipeptide/tripeptide permease